MAPWGPPGWRERKSLCSGPSSTGSVILAVGGLPGWTHVGAAPPAGSVGACTLLRPERSAPVLSPALKALSSLALGQHSLGAEWGRDGGGEKSRPRDEAGAAVACGLFPRADAGGVASIAGEEWAGQVSSECGAAVQSRGGALRSLPGGRIIGAR